MSNIDKQGLRTTHLAEAEGIKNKKRHGFFSVPMTTAVGDDGPYKTKLHPRNQMGKPETKPRNFQTSPPRSGQLTKSFLGPLNSLASTGKTDEFVEEPKRFMRQDHSSRKHCPHEKQFYPQHTYRIQKDSAYEHIDENNPEKEPKRNREADGKVKSQPRQFQSNPQKRVLSDYFKPIKNVSDPLEREHDINWEHYKQEKAKEGEAVFRPNKFRSDLFNSDKAVLNDHEIKRERYFLETKFKVRAHERRWRDTNANRRGLYGYFQPFPEYIEDPPRQVTRKDKSSDKQIFKAMSRTPLVTPSPSVSQNSINLRKTFCHSFSHRPA